MDEFRKELQKIMGMIRDLQAASIRMVKVVFPDNRGTMRVPKYTTDPASPTDGEIWYNMTSNTFKCRENGTTKTFTTS